MGKRELVLVLLFAVLGVVVYQVTAPAPPPGTEGASLSGIWRRFQHHVRGLQSIASADATQAAPADGVRELRITIPDTSDITVTGDERGDLSATLHAEARGFDDAEARIAVSAPHLRLERAGDAILVRTELSKGLPRSTPPAHVTLTLKVPRQIAVHVEPNFGTLAISNVASVEAMGSRGDLHLTSIGGTANIIHSGPQLTIDGCQDLKLTNRGGVSTIRNVAGQASIEPTGGRLTLDHVTGPLDIDSHGGAITLTGVDHLKGPLRINAVGGTLHVDGLRAETRIDSRNTPIDITMAAAAPITIYTTAEDVAITPSGSGYILDAMATNGRVSVDDAPLEPSTSDQDQRANGPVRGGGPPLVLRATRANIRVRTHTSGK